LAVTIAAIALRLPRLVQRPMHTDEAVHAVKFGHLLEENSYRYDPHEFHGPTLNYFTLIPAWVTGVTKFKDLNEFTLRIVPVAFGVLLVFMSFFLTKGLGPAAALFTALFTAVSPAFVFYSRYYIQEMLLVFFTFTAIICGYRYATNKSIKWAVLTGVSLGLMHATKETCIIAFASMLLALLLTMIVQHNRESAGSCLAGSIKSSHILTALVAAVAVSALFYSSFFTNPHGILDSFAAYNNYFRRAAQNQMHIHPSNYYLKMLIYYRLANGPAWSEAFIVALAAVGFLFAMTKTYTTSFDVPLVRFIAFYALIMTIIYSAIPYKTPWSMLGFLHAMILLAGIAAAVLIQISNSAWKKLVVAYILAASIFALAAQAYLQTYYYYAGPANPYVYAHPTNDVLAVTDKINQLAEVVPDGRNIYIQVICPNDDYWPLPWYLRKFTNVGWWNKVPQNTPPASVILASPTVEPALLKKLYESPPAGKRNLYVPLFNKPMQLRPQVQLRGYITKDLSDIYNETTTKQK